MPKSLYRPEHDRLLRLLREARLAAGLTQGEVAERLGRPQSFVSKVESGERRLDVLEFCDLCAAVGASPAELLVRLLGVETGNPSG
jgi:transcriptional regulator with XRE-family HTH domain